MKLLITSHRGHHECILDEPEVSQNFYEKMTGLRTEALPQEYKGFVPENFDELEKLWKTSTMGFSAIGFDENQEVIAMNKFNPEVKEMVYIAPITGG